MHVLGRIFWELHIWIYWGLHHFFWVKYIQEHWANCTIFYWIWGRKNVTLKTSQDSSMTLMQDFCISNQLHAVPTELQERKVCCRWSSSIFAFSAFLLFSRLKSLEEKTTKLFGSFVNEVHSLKSTQKPFRASVRQLLYRPNKKRLTVVKYGSSMHCSDQVWRKFWKD